MSDIKIVVNTKPAVFSFGTEPGLWEFYLADSNGVTLANGASTAPEYLFPDVVPGTYLVIASRNGVPAQAAITVPGEDVTFDVPSTITVTLG